MEILITLALVFAILIGLLVLAISLKKLNDEKVKNDILVRREKEQSEELVSYKTKLMSLSPNPISFREKMKYDFRIKEVLSSIANSYNDVIFTSACLFHNGGHIPTQLSMIYQEHNLNGNFAYNYVSDERALDIFQGVRTNEIYQPILALLDSKYLKINNINPIENKFYDLLYKTGTRKYLAFCIKYDDNTPVMFVSIHFSENAQITEELIDSIEKEIQVIKPDVINLFAYKLKA